MTNLLDLEVENLENRLMLAGNVEVSFDFGDGDVSINGDNQSNEVVVETLGNSTAVVRGTNGTTINGSSGALTVPIGGKLRINLRNGDNRFLIHPGDIGSLADFQDDVSIRSGNGNDVFVLHFGTLEDDLNIRTRGGDDVVIPIGEFNGRLNFNTGSGNDIVGLESAVTNDRVSFRTGRGDDAVLISNSGLNDRVNISTGSGDDHVATTNSEFTERVQLNGGSGHDLYWRSTSAPSNFVDLDVDNFELEPVTQNPDFTLLLTTTTPVFEEALQFIVGNGFNF